MNPIETVQQLYADFGRGDVPAILARLADDVDWEYNTFPNPVPWLQPRRGRDQVAGFFQALAGLEFSRFEPLQCFGSGQFVVSLVNVEFTVKATGRRWSNWRKFTSGTSTPRARWPASATVWTAGRWRKR